MQSSAWHIIVAQWIVWMEINKNVPDWRSTWTTAVLLTCKYVRNHLEILLNCSFWCCRSGWSLTFCISKKLPDDVAVTHLHNSVARTRLWYIARHRWWVLRARFGQPAPLEGIDSRGDQEIRTNVSFGVIFHFYLLSGLSLLSSPGWWCSFPSVNLGSYLSTFRRVYKRLNEFSACPSKFPDALSRSLAMVCLAVCTWQSDNTRSPSCTLIWISDSVREKGT